MYELTVLLKPDLGEKELDKTAKDLHTLLEKNGAKVKASKDAAKRPTAYEIGNYREAYYLYLESEIAADKVQTVDNSLKLQDKVIRYLLVKKN